MIVKEYLVHLPITSLQFWKYRLYESINTIARTDVDEVDWIRRDQVGRDTATCTDKVFRIDDSVPWIVRKMVGEELFVVRERLTDAFPYVKYVFNNPNDSKKRCSLTIEALVTDGVVTKENMLQLPNELRKHRKRSRIEVSGDVQTSCSQLHVVVYGSCNVSGLRTFFRRAVSSQLPTLIHEMVSEIAQSMDNWNGFALAELKEIEACVWKAKFGEGDCES